MSNKVGIALLAAMLVLAVSACQRNNNGAPDQANPPAASPTGTTTAPAASPPGTTTTPAPGGTVAAADAEALYKSKCVACHAADLHGGVGPNLQDVGARMSPDDIAAKIAAGGGGMTAFKGILTDDEIRSLTDWLATKKG